MFMIDIILFMRPPAKNMPDAFVRVAELEAQLAANEQELRESKARYDELRHRIKTTYKDLRYCCPCRRKYPVSQTIVGVAYNA